MAKCNKKVVWLGIGIAVAAASAALLLASNDETQEKITAFINKQKVKSYVRDNLNGNEKAMKMIDNMNDGDINKFMSLLAKTSDLKDNFLDNVESAKDFLVEKKKHLF
ncbi:hypothetical protein [Granulicatella seriolae]|uniref:Uncharacterized protein n=1 Tax=Granulicatella seriolae TaxID=2967226 RepID=A0ABT1WQL1_9LACT|nr:hypothetical protein [Granulicatella seriolae]